jgi:hypothetical protein
MTQRRSGCTSTGWSRREFGAGAMLLGLVLGVSPAHVLAVEAPSRRTLALLSEVSQLVIPHTDTPGAGDVGTGAFVALALAHGLNDTRKPLVDPAPGLPLRADGSLHYDVWLDGELSRRAGGDFLAQPPARRAQILAALDAEAFASGKSPWIKLKALILTGYYTSEVGGSKELQYELVPGRFDVDLPVHPGDRAWSSDWTAVEFG